MARIRESLPRKAFKDAVALLTASHQQTARFLPLHIAECKRLKAALGKWIR